MIQATGYTRLATTSNKPRIIAGICAMPACARPMIPDCAIDWFGKDILESSRH